MTRPQAAPRIVPPHNLFGDHGPICPWCSGLGRYLQLGSAGWVTRSTTPCRCRGTGVDQELLQLRERDTLLARIAALEHLAAWRAIDCGPRGWPPDVKNSRQFWSELISWATVSGAAVGNTVSETPIMPNILFPANYIQDGRTMRFTVTGQIGATATPTMTWRMRWGNGGTILCQSAAITLAAVTAAMFKLEMEMTTRANGSSGSVMANGIVHWGQTIKTTNTPDMLGSAGATTPAAVTVDLTADTAFQITAQWGTQNALNTTTGLNYLVESLN